MQVNDRFLMRCSRSRMDGKSSSSLRVPNGVVSSRGSIDTSDQRRCQPRPANKGLCHELSVCLRYARDAPLLEASVQVLYATHLPVTETSDASDGARVLADWLRERFSIDVEPWESRETGLVVAGPRHIGDQGGIATDVSGRLTLSTLSGVVGRIWRAEIDHSDFADETWTWRTTAWWGEPSDLPAWLRCQLAIESNVEARVSEPQIEVFRPGLVANALERLPVRVDGRNPGDHRVISRDVMANFIEWLVHPTRRLPVIVTTDGADQSSQALGREILRRLAGLVHVVHLESAATYALTDAMGQFRSVFGGALRLYWPGFGRLSDGYAHPLWVPRQLDYLGDARFVRELTTRIGRVAAMTIGVPELERTLRTELREAQAEQRRRERGDLDARLREATTTAGPTASVIDLQTWEQFCRDFDALELRVTELDDDNTTLELELEEERGRREAAEQQAKLAWTTVRAEHGEEPEGGEVLEHAPPRTILQAVERLPPIALISSSSPRHSMRLAIRCFPDPGKPLTISCCSRKWRHLGQRARSGQIFGLPSRRGRRPSGRVYRRPPKPDTAKTMNASISTKGSC
jgi:hypothetical protein